MLLPGRLTNWKGQMFFLKTLVKMKNENLLNNINSVILGDNQGREEYKNNLTKIINENFLQNNVKLINHESHMPSAYLASDLVLSASMGAWIAINILNYFKKKIIGLITIGAAPDFTEEL
ncbi:MAG: glycosyltransferase, partial [Candidatus Fonsibacter sp.]